MEKFDEGKLPIRRQIVCPHCWTRFAAEDILWVAAAPDLIGDSRLGALEPSRFLPVRFDLNGNAVDRKGFVCKQLACPYCHLPIPRVLTEIAPFFLSVVGAPASGKTYFLTSMVWQLRSTFLRDFAFTLAESDAKMNARI